MVHVPVVGINPGHQGCVDQIRAVSKLINIQDISTLNSFKSNLIQQANHKMSDWESNILSAKSRAPTAKSTRKKTAFSIRLNKVISPRRRSSKSNYNDNLAFEADRLPPSLKNSFRSRQSIPAHKDSVNVSTVSKRVDALNDPNFAWID